MQKCIFFVVPGDREALLGMPDIELLNILNINCSTIGAEKEEEAQIAMWAKIVSSVQEVSSVVQTRIASLVQEVSSAVQTQVQKRVGLGETATQAAT